MMFRIFIIFFCVVFGTATLAEPVEITFWHSMAGQLGVEIERITAGFNASQDEFKIKPVYKGDYIETLTGFAAAYRAGQPPAMIQIVEMGTKLVLNPKGIIKPVDTLMVEQGKVVPKTSIFPAQREYYTVNQQLMAMPLNTSIPVMFYNADALSKLGYGAHNFPKTWQEFEVLAKKIIEAGYPCAYTTGYPAWILLDSFAAIHGLSMFSEDGNHALYDNDAIINHIKRLTKWQKKHYFEYGGRSDDATVLFTSGRCPLYSQSSGGYNSFSEMVPFKVGVASMPLDTTVSAKRFNNITGGAALWAVNGFPDKIYQGIAQFLMYFLKADIQLRWHVNTGYLPLGINGIYQDIPTLSNHPVLALSQQELMHQSLRPLRGSTGMQNQIRQINDEELEAVFSGIILPEKALRTAVRRANEALERFRRNTQ